MDIPLHYNNVCFLRYRYSMKTMHFWEIWSSLHHHCTFLNVTKKLLFYQPLISYSQNGLLYRPSRKYVKKVLVRTVSKVRLVPTGAWLSLADFAPFNIATNFHVALLQFSFFFLFFFFFSLSSIFVFSLNSLRLDIILKGVSHMALPRSWVVQIFIYIVMLQKCMDSVMSVGRRSWLV